MVDKRRFNNDELKLLLEAMNTLIEIHKEYMLRVTGVDWCAPGEAENEYVRMIELASKLETMVK